MPGGETTSRKKPHRNLKGASQKAADVIALSGGELLGSEANMQLFRIPGEYVEDTDYGLPAVGPMSQEYTEDTQGNNVWKNGKPPAAVKANITPPKKADATPGGGW